MMATATRTAYEYIHICRGDHVVKTRKASMVSTRIRYIRAPLKNHRKEFTCRHHRREYEGVFHVWSVVRDIQRSNLIFVASYAVSYD